MNIILPVIMLIEVNFREPVWGNSAYQKSKI